jgi:CBS domain-containing protein
VLLVRPAPGGRTGGEAEAARREARASALRPAPLGSEAPLEELVEEVRPLRATDRLADAAARVAEAGCGLPVVDAGGRLVGYLSERDILRAVLSPYLQVLGETGFLTYDLPSLVRRVREVASSAVGEHMSRDLPAVPVDASVMHLVEQMLHHGLASAPAIDADGRLAGVLRGMSVVLDLFRRAGAPADAPAEAAEPGG